MLSDTASLGEFPIGGTPLIGFDYRTWELRVDKDQVSRFGLALMRDTPNILSINKINRFFGGTTFSYSTALGKGLDDNDYRTKLLFSTYQYGYNITLQNISPMKPGEPKLMLMLGQPYPAGYGYIRRYVVIKQNSNGAAINLDQRPEFNATREDEVNQKIWVRLDGSVFYNNSIDTPFKLDLQREPLIINISGLHTVLNNSAYNPSPMAIGTFQTAKLTAITFSGLGPPSIDLTNFIQSCGQGMCVDLSVDGNNQPFPLTGGVDVTDKINLSANYIDANYLNKASDLVVTFTFQDFRPGTEIPNSVPEPHTLVNGEYLYDYNPANVTQPFLSTGMLEVGIW